MNLVEIKENLLKLNIGDVLENEPLYKHTTYKVGGPAAFYVKVKDVMALAKVLGYIKKENIPYYIIGRGSNILFSDSAYDGIILSLNEEFDSIRINGCAVKAEAGVSDIYLSSYVAKAGLAGLEFISGIPGSVGGAVYMNAGAYKSEIADYIIDITILDENGNMKVISKDEAKFSYRKSIFQTRKDWVILEVTLELIPGDYQEILALMDKRKEKRMLTQPWNMPSAGSVFKNPDNKGAWEYIDGCNLRGCEIGGAQISPKHPNFIVNNGYASAKDILDLITLVRNEVQSKYGIEMHTEIILVNW